MSINVHRPNEGVYEPTYQATLVYGFLLLRGAVVLVVDIAMSGGRYVTLPSSLSSMRLVNDVVSRHVNTRTRFDRSGLIGPRLTRATIGEAGLSPHSHRAQPVAAGFVSAFLAVDLGKRGKVRTLVEEIRYLSIMEQSITTILLGFPSQESLAIESVS